MSKVAQKERVTQNRVVNLFQQQLAYTYYGDWLRKQGHDDSLITNAIRKLKQAAAPDGRP